MPRSAAIVEAKKIIPIPLVTTHGLDPGFGGPHRVPAGLPRRTATPPVPRRQRLEPWSVRPSPAPARSGPPAATSASYWTCEARLGLPIPSVRQRALPGARPPLANTHSPMRPRTPRRTRRSKRISLRSLSFVAGENARVQHIVKSAGTFTPTEHTSFVLPLLVVVCSCGLFLRGAATHEKVPGSGRNKKFMLACPAASLCLRQSEKILLRSMPGPESA